MATIEDQDPTGFWAVRRSETVSKEDHDRWAHDMTARVGREIAKRRKELGYTGHDLAVRCTERGLEMTRSAVANLETGRKQSMPVHELVVFARILAVPPLELLYPDDTDGDGYQYLPGKPWAVEACRMEFAGGYTPDLGVMNKIYSLAKNAADLTFSVMSHQEGKQAGRSGEQHGA